MTNNNAQLKILTLDGGGSKGVYTLGVLSELEQALNKPLHEYFELIYGTSTGSIIAAMLALGMNTTEIKKAYFELIPAIMCKRSQKKKSGELSRLGKEIFGERTFEAFNTNVGIVAMNYDNQKPLIFKSNLNAAHGSKTSFVPGFGVTILDAIEASCAACPIFSKKVLNTKNKEKLTAIDGGFIANNPTLFALIDAKQALGREDHQIKLLSIGVGNYVEKPFSRTFKFLSRFEMAQITSKVLVASSNTTEVVTGLLFPNLPMVRINDTFNEPHYGTNMVEKDPNKLSTLFKLGIDSYAKHEKAVQNLLELST